jgi:hypothetical protein
LVELDADDCEELANTEVEVELTVAMRTTAVIPNDLITLKYVFTATPP